MKGRNGLKQLVFEVNVFFSQPSSVLGRKTRLVKKELHLPAVDAAGTFRNGVLHLYPGGPVTALSMTEVVIFWKN